MANEPRTLCDIFSAAGSSGRPDLLISKVAGEWKPISAADFSFTVRSLSLGLNALGIQPGDRVAILSENRPEWAMADFAILCAGAWSVPIYPTLPANQIAPLLKDCGAKAIFCSTLEQLGKILTIRSQCGKLDHVIAVEGSPPGEPGYTTFHAVVDKGRPTLEMSPNVFEQRAARVRVDDVATIIYTSGTTGEPKGAMLTHGNFTSNVVSGCEVIPLTGEGIALSFLPLSHVFERMLDYSYFYRKTSIAYAESIDKLSANFLEVKPVCFGAVPRVYEKVYARIMGQVEGGPGWKKKLFAWTVEVGKQRVPYMERGEKLPPGLARKAKIADALVFKKIRARLGGRFQFAVSGGAPLSRSLAEFFIGAGVQIYEGYGLTETSPVIAVNTPGNFRIGTVGRPVAGVEVMIAPDGEICTRGPHVMKGYYNKPEATREAIDADGWFHTGDIGELRDGFLAITDRKKDIIVTAGGKKIAPQPLETKVKTNKYVSQAVMIGDKRKFPSILIVPNFDQLEKWSMRQNIIWTDRAQLLTMPTIQKKMEKEVFGKLKGAANFEMPKKIALLEHDFSLERGELTPTQKVKRRVIDKQYKQLIDSLYEEK